MYQQPVSTAGTANNHQLLKPPGSGHRQPAAAYPAKTGVTPSLPRR